MKAQQQPAETQAAPAPQVQPEPAQVVPPVEAAPEPVAAQPTVVESRAVRGGKRGKQQRVPAVVTPSLPSQGEISVNSEPDGAQFQIDGRSDARFVTPATIGQLSPGRHTG